MSKIRKAPFSRIILITGATSGIGKATAKLFAKNGYSVIITGRRKSKLQDIKNRLEKKYAVRVKALNFDVRNYKAVAKSISGLSSEWKAIDILVNNAGLAKGYDPIHEGKISDWEQMIDTNIKGLLYLTRLVTPGMVKRKSGHVINICSSAGHEVYPKGNVYCASKFAVKALTQGMRIDLYTHGIRVSQVSPGHVEETEFASVRFNGDEEKSRIYDDFNPLTSKDVANSILYIASQPKHVNIQDIVLMGTQQASNVFIDRSGRMDQ